MRPVILRRGLVALFAAAVSFGAIVQAQAETLRIGYQKYGTLVLLKAKGTLDKRLALQGVDVKWTEFPGGPQLLEGLNVGSIDVGVTGETPPVFAQAVFLPPADARAAFERGSVDAWVILAPYQAAAGQQLQARTLHDGSGIVDNHQFYLATKPYAQQHPEVIKALVEEVRAVGEWSKANPQEVTEQVASLLGLSTVITLTLVKRQGYGAGFLTPEVIAAQQKIADSFYQLKLIPMLLSIQDVIWTPPAAVAKAP
ncbi:ABC transporter substrate-binding protein [Pseudomonas sp. LD120]|uniref:ABC transporter substrate-binding protein n=1 Tax=Pseudomonas sp. LD120 TaxID=485751 RepID=UPI00135A9F2A|nr:ABC transporter substrate-binding protein [Pseudomonas sp. LD120]KAF0864857.1 ABC transporter substrate-binding protein [Pseudomonas sp. LD120]